MSKILPESVPSLHTPAACEARILIVDDEPANVLLLQRILSGAGYENLTPVCNGFEALDACAAETFDLILLDLMMPGRDGYSVLEELKTLCADEFLPVLVLTADVSPSAKRRALSAGAKDFLTKPFDAIEVLLRVKNLLETRSLTMQLREHNRTLEARVAQRTAALQKSQMEVLSRLAQAAELRDDDTGQHTQRVGELAARLARKIGLEEARVELIRRAAPLHDVGKIGISDSILLKPGTLTVAEFETMKTHPLIGAELLGDGQSPFVRLAELIALTHHERFDGSGYPKGLRGEEIPIEGRILSIVDVFDALTHERPYKKAWSRHEALREIAAQKGRQFDPHLVDAFVEMLSGDCLTEGDCARHPN